jgi:transposase
MIRSGLINMIREKAQKGKSAYAIGKELGISKNTAKKYMNQPRAEHGLKGRKKPSKLDPFKPEIHEMLKAVAGRRVAMTPLSASFDMPSSDA